MPKRPKDITTAELAILKELWDQRSATISNLAQTLYGESNPSTVATVHRLLARLEGKSWVARDGSQWPHQFRAALPREELVLQRVQAVSNELCDGTLNAVLPHLVKAELLGKRDRKLLRKLLDDLEDSL